MAPPVKHFNRHYYTKFVRNVAYVGGCCRPPLADSAFRVPPVPDHHTSGSMVKINVVRFPQDGEIILHPPFRRQIAKLKIKARRNEITVRTKSHIPRRPKGGAAKRALCGVRICRGEAVASERRPYQVGATDLHPALSSPSATPLRSGDTRRG